MDSIYSGSYTTVQECRRLYHLGLCKHTLRCLHNKNHLTVHLTECIPLVNGDCRCCRKLNSPSIVVSHTDTFYIVCCLAVSVVSIYWIVSTQRAFLNVCSTFNLRLLFVRISGSSYLVLLELFQLRFLTTSFIESVFSFMTLTIFVIPVLKFC